MNKCLILFVEGETEIEFYKQMISNAKKHLPAGKFDTNIEYRNVKGVGGFKNNALRKFIKEIKPKYKKDCEFTVVLCSDTDVFDFTPKPPINWREVKKELKDNGVSKIIHIQAKQSIEDWFLYDAEGIIKFLRLSKKTKPSGKNGYEKLQSLYKKANKTYFKGIKSNGMVARLDIEKISNEVKDQLIPLYKVLGDYIKT